ncbi:MAG TPA: hypothetical protein VHR86_00230, partial [Armatimonadota bacterium]|nr:hypothetical protein [Armatimonadota bacterium]
DTVPDQFGLETVKEALYCCVIPTVSLVAHRREHPMIFEQPLVVTTGILAAPVRVVDQACHRAPLTDRQLQRVYNEAARHRLFHQPSYHPACTQVQPHRQVKPACGGRQASDPPPKHDWQHSL